MKMGAHYVIIERDDHPDILSIDSEEFDMFMRAIFYKNTGRVIGRDSVTNTKMLLKAFTNKQKILYNRSAKIGDSIFYDLGNENRKCIEVTKESWGLIDNPCIFRRSSYNDSTQVFPARKTGISKRYLREILDKTTIKYRHQKLIVEVYIISLFITNISHPILLAIGPPGSGKTVLLRTIKLIVDPMNEIESLVKGFPETPETDGLISIRITSHTLIMKVRLNQLLWTKCALGLQGSLVTVRVLHTTDESRTYSGKRPIGITSIDIPITNSDAMKSIRTY